MRRGRGSPCRDPSERVTRVSDLAPATVEQLLQALGLEYLEDDVPQVAYRVNAVLDAFAELDGWELERIEPRAVFPPQGEA